MASPARRLNPHRPHRLTHRQIAYALRDLCRKGFLERFTDQGGITRYRLVGKGKHR
jgi:Winged helix DNA-binding domain